MVILGLPTVMYNLAVKTNHTFYCCKRKTQIVLKKLTLNIELEVNSNIAIFAVIVIAAISVFAVFALYCAFVVFIVVFRDREN